LKKKGTQRGTLFNHRGALNSNPKEFQGTLGFPWDKKVGRKKPKNQESRFPQAKLLICPGKTLKRSLKERRLKKV